jgi:hypothetical protein
MTQRRMLANASFRLSASDGRSELIMGGSWVEGNNVTTAKLKKEMVGTRRLELLTSTVSNLGPVRDDATPKKSE